MQIGQIYRAAKPFAPEPKEIDGYPNFFSATHTAGQKMLVLGRGIFGVRALKTVFGTYRRPLVALSTSIANSGTTYSPWIDDLNSIPDVISYAGDNKIPEQDALESSGNNLLVLQHSLSSSDSRSMRTKASPILCFERVKVGNKVKGFLKFRGYGFVLRHEEVTEYLPSGTPFGNFRFQIKLLEPHSPDVLDWDWISKRRSSSVSDEECLQYAPHSWREAVEKGFPIIS